MSEDKIRYHVLVQEAMRGVVRSVLQRVQRRGMPGDHHFYIIFDTQAPGVGLSKRLKERYPQEMTIVLQHQYQDLNVLDDRFEVRLYFANMPERLVVPFTAIKSFNDPSVPFGINLSLFSVGSQQAKGTGTAPTTVNENAEKTPPADGQSTVADERSQTPEAKAAPVSADAAAPSNPESNERADAKVVDLDRFRKK
jgi:uncharacterized protein